MSFVTAPASAPADATIAALRQDMARVSAELDGLLAAFLDVQRAISALAGAPASPVLESIERTPAKPAEAAPASVWNNTVWYVYDLEAEASRTPVRDAALSETASDDWAAVLPLLHEFDRVCVIKPFSEVANDDWNSVLPLLHEFDRVCVVQPFPEVADDDWDAVIPFLHESDRVSLSQPFIDGAEAENDACVWDSVLPLLHESDRVSLSQPFIEKAEAMNDDSDWETVLPLLHECDSVTTTQPPPKATGADVDRALNALLPELHEFARMSAGVTASSDSASRKHVDAEWSGILARFDAFMWGLAGAEHADTPSTVGVDAAGGPRAVCSTDIVAIDSKRLVNPAAVDAAPATPPPPTYNKLPDEILYACAKPKAHAQRRRPKKSIDKQIAKKGFEYFCLSASANVRLNFAWQFAAYVQAATTRARMATSKAVSVSALVPLRVLVQHVFFVAVVVAHCRKTAEAPLAIEVD